jgi:hypothetical protein
VLCLGVDGGRTGQQSEAQRVAWSWSSVTRACGEKAAGMVGGACLREARSTPVGPA